ncbi:MAG: FAD-dependent oxidoreductase [Acidimicrobiales bacterium]
MALRVVVIGAGVAGLGSALALARDGHEVTVLERDDAPMPTDPEDAFAWDRRGAPQVRHSHAFLARVRNLLRDHYPDVLADLHAAGATDVQPLDDFPGVPHDTERLPGDEDLVALACRRTTFEWVLRRAALASPRVRLTERAVVDGVAVEDGIGRRPPVAVGVRLRDGAIVAADVVVAANGPRAPIGRWLGDAGVEIEESFEETGIVYLSRFYRRVGDGPDEEPTPFVLADLGFLKCAVFRGDNRTFSVTLAPFASDRELRAGLTNADAFVRACQAIAPLAPWVGPERAAPLTGVHVMARLGNHRRGFLDAADRPAVLGFHAVGDAHTCTNPIYGRGCTLAMVQANLLAGVVRDHPCDPLDRAVAFEAATAREIEPWYHVAVAQDRFSRASAGPAGSPGDEDTEAFIGRMVRDGLIPAARSDTVVARAFLRVLNVLETPDRLLHDADVAGRIFHTLADPEARNVVPDFGVDRDAVLAALDWNGSPKPP